VDEGTPPADGRPVRPSRTRSPGGRPRALVTSVAFGVIGAVLLLAGLFGGSEPLVLSAVAAGTVSLIAVLVWREQLIATWRRGGRPTP
jgi:hypothetical protein